MRLMVINDFVSCATNQGGHFNPVSKKWNLAKDDLGYFWSSAKFYETGIDEFGFLNNLYKVFDGD